MLDGTYEHYSRQSASQSDFYVPVRSSPPKSRSRMSNRSRSSPSPNSIKVYERSRSSQGPTTQANIQTRIETLETMDLPEHMGLLEVKSKLDRKHDSIETFGDKQDLEIEPRFRNHDLNHEQFNSYVNTQSTADKFYPKYEQFQSGATSTDGFRRGENL